jgi:hypothetical protein
MGSEQFKRTGLQRDSEGCKGFPEQFTIVGVDISPEDLKKRYEGTKRHRFVCEVIDGLVQKQRTKTGSAPGWLVDMLRTATNIPAIRVVDLGRDGTLDGWEEVDGKKKKAGKNWVLIDDGRQRDMAMREINRTSGKPPRMLDATFVIYSSKGTYADAVMSKVGGNVRVARSFSQRAEDAADMARANYTHEAIVPFVEARDAAEVGLLLCLHQCVDEVKDAVDAGRVLLAECKKLSKETESEQIRLIARKTAVEPGANRGKKTRDAQNAAAPPKPRARPRAWCENLATKASTSEATFSGVDMAAIIRVLQGDQSAMFDEGVSDAARALLKAADAATKGKGGAANDTSDASEESRVAAE